MVESTVQDKSHLTGYVQQLPLAATLLTLIVLFHWTNLNP